MKERTLSIYLALVPIIVVVFLGLMSVIVWKVGMFIPLIGSISSACLIGAYLGYKWEDLQQGLVDGVSRALPALFILIIVGAITGSWIHGGIIPTMIYYCLDLISPGIFVPASCLVVSIISLSIGSSFTSIATIGLALMATGLAMGFPAHILAAAIICGAFFGDSLSPLSDSPNLASAMTGDSIFELIGHMAYTAIPAIFITSGMFFIISRPYSTSLSGDSQLIASLISGIEEEFVISPLLLLVPLLTIIMSIKKFPALPTLVVVALVGGLCGVFVQGQSVGSALVAMTRGYVSDTGIEMVDQLLSSGGITSMANTVMLMTLATALGGILEKIGFLQVLVGHILKPVKTTGGLVSVTVLSGLVVAFATGAQLLAIVLPARMYKDQYQKRGLHSKNLGRIAVQIGCVCITLVPWSVPASYAAGVLNVLPGDFIPYLFFPMVLIVLNILFAYTGLTMTKIEAKDDSKT